MFKKEKLTFEQIRILKERNPDNNRTKFFERVSKLFVSNNTDHQTLFNLLKYSDQLNPIIINR